jgi:hypothetical protein
LVNKEQEKALEKIYGSDYSNEDFPVFLTKSFFVCILKCIYRSFNKEINIEKLPSFSTTDFSHYPLISYFESKFLVRPEDSYLLSYFYPLKDNLENFTKIVDQIAEKFISSTPKYEEIPFEYPLNDSRTNTPSFITVHFTNDAKNLIVVADLNHSRRPIYSFQRVPIVLNFQKGNNSPFQVTARQFSSSHGNCEENKSTTSPQIFISSQSEQLRSHSKPYDQSSWDLFDSFPQQLNESFFD